MTGTDGLAVAIFVCDPVDALFIVDVVDGIVVDMGVFVVAVFCAASVNIVAEDVAGESGR